MKTRVVEAPPPPPPGTGCEEPREPSPGFRPGGDGLPVARLSWWGRVARFVRNNRDLMGIIDGARTYVGPSIVQLDITNNCNNDCIACWTKSPLLLDREIEREERMKYLPYEMILALLDDLQALGTREIYMAGAGDPQVHPRFLDVITAMKARGFVVYVNTNFLVFTEAWIRHAVEIGVDFFTISNWAGTPEGYARTHPNKTEEAFHELREKLDYLTALKRGRKPWVKHYNVISHLNYMEIGQMVDFAVETGAEWVEFCPVDTIPGRTDFLLLSAEETDWTIAACARVEKRLRAEGRDHILYNWEQWMRRLRDPGSSQGQYERGVVFSMPCTVGWTFCRINPDGDVNSCLKSHRFPIGNLHQSRFRDIWAGARQNFFRAKANVCEKTDPFFRLIGNDPDTKVSGCLKSCDDIGRNLVIDNRMRALSPAKRAILRAAKLYYDVTGRAISPDHPLPARIGPPWRQPPDAQAADAPPTRRATAAPTPAHAPASPGVSLPAFPAVASGAGS